VIISKQDMSYISSSFLKRELNIKIVLGLFSCFPLSFSAMLPFSLKQLKKSV
jgi:hypothetical protein